MNYRRRWMLFALLAWPVQAALARGKRGLARADQPDLADLAYATTSPRSNLLDLYLPEAVTDAPLVIYVHGGGFWGGDKRRAAPLARCLPSLLQAGIAVASVNYRLSGEAIWPAQRDDLAAALAFLRAHAAELGFDSERIAFFGSSAGGSLALIAGFDAARTAPGALKAIAAWFPAILYTEMDADLAKDGPVPQDDLKARKGSSISRLVGAAVGRNPRPALQASPITLLQEVGDDQPLPAILLAAGREDRTVSWRQSQRMADALRQRANPPEVDFTLYEASGHGDGDFDGLAADHLVEFLIRALQRR